MTHGYLSEAAPVGYLKEDASAVAGADVAVVVFRFGGGKLRLVYDLEVYIQVCKVFLKPGPVGFLDGMFDPVDHDAVEFVGNRKPFAPHGKGHRKSQRVLASRDGQEDVLSVADHVEVVDAFAHVLDEAHDPGTHVSFDDVEVGEFRTVVFADLGILHVENDKRKGSV